MNYAQPLQGPGWKIRLWKWAEDEGLGTWDQFRNGWEGPVPFIRGLNDDRDGPSWPDRLLWRAQCKCSAAGITCDTRVGSLWHAEEPYIRSGRGRLRELITCLWGHRGGDGEMKSCDVRSEGSLCKTNSSRLFHSFLLSFIGLVCLRILIFTFQPSSNNADCLFFFFTLSGDKWTLVLISPLSSYSTAFPLEFLVSNQRLTCSKQSQWIRVFFHQMIFFTQWTY